MEIFIAKYDEGGKTKTIAFKKSRFNKESAEEYLKKNNIQNFWFIFEPTPPKEIGENGIMFSGDVGFDITFDSLEPYLNSGKDIILDTFGGYSWEGLKIHDYIKSTGKNPSIGVLGNCMSAGMQILLATENRWMTKNSRGLIHNPWTWAVGDDKALKKEAADLEKEKLQIASIYVEASGRDLDHVLALMEEERILRANEMLAYNFVKRIGWNNNQESITNNNNDKMTNEEKDKLNGIEKTVNKILNFFKKSDSEPKNIVIQDVNGVELDFGEEVETVEAISVGDTATADGVPANGEYTMQDGTVHVFESGTLTEIRQPAEETEGSEEMEALKQENEALTTELENSRNENKALNEKLTARDKETLEMKNKFESLSKEIEELKNLSSGEEQKPNTPEGGEGKSKFTYKSKNKK